MNATDSGAPPEARDSAGLSTVTRYVRGPSAPTAAGIAASSGARPTTWLRRLATCSRADCFLASASPPRGPVPVTCSSSASAVSRAPPRAVTDVPALRMAGMLKTLSLNSLESAPLNCS